MCLVSDFRLARSAKGVSEPSSLFKTSSWIERRSRNLFQSLPLLSVFRRNFRRDLDGTKRSIGSSIVLWPNSRHAFTNIPENAKDKTLRKVQDFWPCRGHTLDCLPVPFEWTLAASHQPFHKFSNNERCEGNWKASSTPQDPRRTTYPGSDRSRCLCRRCKTYSAKDRPYSIFPRRFRPKYTPRPRSFLPSVLAACGENRLVT